MRRNIDLTEDEWRALKVYAASQGVTISRAVAMLLEQPKPFRPSAASVDSPPISTGADVSKQRVATNSDDGSKARAEQRRKTHELLSKIGKQSK